MSTMNKSGAVYQPQLTYASANSIAPMRPGGSGSMTARVNDHSNANYAGSSGSQSARERGQSNTKSSKLPQLPAALRNKQATGSTISFDSYASQAHSVEAFRSIALSSNGYIHTHPTNRRKNPTILPAVQVALHKKEKTDDEEKVQLPQWPRASDASRRALVEYLSSSTRCHLFLDYCEIRTVGSTLDHMIALGPGLDDTNPPNPNSPPNEQTSLALLLVALQKMDELGHRFGDLNALVDELEAQCDMNAALRVLYPHHPSKRHMFRLVFEYLSGSDCELFTEAPSPVNASTSEIEVLLEAGGSGVNVGEELQPDEDPSTTLDILVYLDHSQAKFAHFSQLVDAVAREKHAREQKLVETRLMKESLLKNQREKLLNYFVKKNAALGELGSNGGSGEDAAVFFTNTRKLTLKKGELDTIVKVGGGGDHMDELLYLLDIIELQCKNEQAREKMDGIGSSNTNEPKPTPSTTPSSPSLLFINDVATLTQVLQSTFDRAEAYKSSILRWLNSKACTLFTQPPPPTNQPIVLETLNPTDPSQPSPVSPAPINIKQRLEFESRRIEVIQDNLKREMRGLEPLPLPCFEDEPLAPTPPSAVPSTDPVVEDDFQFNSTVVAYIFLHGGAGFNTLTHAQTFQMDSRKFDSIESFINEIKRIHKETEKERDTMKGRAVLRQYLYSKQCKLFSLANASNGPSGAPTTATNNKTNNDENRFSLGNGAAELGLTNSDLDALIKIAGGVNLSLLFLKHFDLYQHRYFSWTSLLHAVQTNFTPQIREHQAWQLLHFLSNPNCLIFRVKEPTIKEKKNQPTNSGTYPALPEPSQIYDLETGTMRAEFSSTNFGSTGTIPPSGIPKPSDGPLASPGHGRKLTAGQSLPPYTTERRTLSTANNAPTTADPSNQPHVFTVSNLTLRDMHRLYESSTAGPETLWHLQHLNMYDITRPALKDLDELIALVRRNHQSLLRKLEADLPFLKTYIFGSSRLSSLFHEPLTELYDDWLVRVIMACGGSVSAVIYFFSRVSAEPGTLKVYRDDPNSNATANNNSQPAATGETPKSKMANKSDQSKRESVKSPSAGLRPGSTPTNSTEEQSSTKRSLYVDMPPSWKFEDPATSSTTNSSSNGSNRDALIQLLEQISSSRVGSANSPPVWLLVELQNFLNLKNSGIWKKKVAGVTIQSKVKLDTTAEGVSRPTTQQKGHNKKPSVGQSATIQASKDYLASQLAMENSLRSQRDELELTLTHALDEEFQPDVPYMDLSAVGEIWNELGGMALQIIPHLYYFSSCVRQVAASEAPTTGGKHSKKLSSGSFWSNFQKDPLQPPSKPCESLNELIDTLRRVHMFMFTSINSNNTTPVTPPVVIPSHIEILLTYLYAPISQLLPRPTPKDTTQYTTFLHPVNLFHLHYNRNTTFWTSNPATFSFTTNQIAQLVRTIHSTDTQLLKSVSLETAESTTTDTSVPPSAIDDPSHTLAVLIELDIVTKKQAMEVEFQSRPPLTHSSITATPTSFLHPDGTIIPSPITSFQALLYWTAKIALVQLEDKIALLTKLTAVDPATGLSLFFHENLPTKSEAAENSSTQQEEDPTLLSTRSHLALTLTELSRFFSTRSGGGLEGLPRRHELICSIFWKLVRSGATFSNFASLVSSMRVALLYVVHTERQEKQLLVNILHGAGVGLIAPPPILPPTEAQVNLALKDQATGFLKRLATRTTTPSSNPNNTTISDELGDVQCVATYPHRYQPTKPRYSELELEALLTYGGSNQACVTIYWLMRIVEWKNEWANQQVSKVTNKSDQSSSTSSQATHSQRSSVDLTSTEAHAQLAALPPGYHVQNPFVFDNVYALAHFIHDLRFRDGLSRQRELTAYLSDPNCPLFGAIPSVFITADAIDKIYYESIPGSIRQIKDAQGKIVTTSIVPQSTPLISIISSTPLTGAPGDILFHLWCFESLGLTADSLFDLIDLVKSHIVGLGERRKSERMVMIAILGQTNCPLLRKQTRNAAALTQAQIQDNLAAKKASAYAAKVAASLNESGLDTPNAPSAAGPLLTTHAYVGRKPMAPNTPTSTSNQAATKSSTNSSTYRVSLVSAPTNNIVVRPFFSGFHSTLAQLDALISSAGRSILYVVTGLLELSVSSTIDGLPIEFKTWSKLQEALIRWFEIRKDAETAVTIYLNQSVPQQPQLQPHPPQTSGPAAVGGRTAQLTISVSASTASIEPLVVSPSRGGRCILFSHAPVPVIWSPQLVSQLFVRSGTTSDSGSSLMDVLSSLNETIHAGWQHYGSSLSNAEQLFTLLKREDEFLRWRKKHFTRDLLTGGSNTAQAREIAHLCADQFISPGGRDSAPTTVNFLAAHYLLDRFRDYDEGAFVIKIPVPLSMIQHASPNLDAIEDAKTDTTPTKTPNRKAATNTKHNADTVHDVDPQQSHFLPGSRRLGLGHDDSASEWLEEEAEGESATERMKALEREIAAEEAEAERVAQEEAAAAKAAALEAARQKELEGSIDLSGDAPQPPNEATNEVNTDGMTASDSAINSADGSSSSSTDSRVNEWMYLDDEQNTQGPFSLRMMSDWLTHGSLPPTLLVKTVTEYSQPDTKWRPISTRSEFLVIGDDETKPSLAQTPSTTKGRVPMTAAQPQHIHSSSRTSVVPASLPLSMGVGVQSMSGIAPTPPAVAPPPQIQNSRAASVVRSTSMAKSASNSSLPTATPVVPTPNLYEVVHPLDHIDPNYTPTSAFADSQLINFKLGPQITNVIATAGKHGPLMSRESSSPHTVESNNPPSITRQPTAASPHVPAVTAAAASTVNKSTPPTTAPVTPLTGPTTVTSPPPPPAATAPPARKLATRTSSAIPLEDDPDEFEAAARAADAKKENLFNVDEFDTDQFQLESEPVQPVVQPPPPKISAEKVFFLATEPKDLAAMDAPLKDELEVDLDIDHDLPSLDALDDTNELEWTPIKLADAPQI